MFSDKYRTVGERSSSFVTRLFHQIAHWQFVVHGSTVSLVDSLQNARGQPAAAVIAANIVTHDKSGKRSTEKERERGGCKGREREKKGEKESVRTQLSGLSSAAFRNRSPAMTSMEFDMSTNNSVTAWRIFICRTLSSGPSAVTSAIYYRHRAAAVSRVPAAARRCLN